MKKLWAVLGGMVLGMVLVAYGVAHAYSNITADQTIVNAFGYVDIANSPADVTTMTNAAAARTATDLPAFAHIRILCTENAFYKMGTSSVVAAAGDVYIPKNVVMVETMGPDTTGTRISFIQDSATAAGRCQAKYIH